MLKYGIFPGYVVSQRKKHLALIIKCLLSRVNWIYLLSLLSSSRWWYFNQIIFFRIRSKIAFTVRSKLTLWLDALHHPLENVFIKFDSMPCIQTLKCVGVWDFSYVGFGFWYIQTSGLLSFYTRKCVPKIVFTFNIVEIAKPI